MTDKELYAEIEACRAELLEAKRYVRSRPGATTEGLQRFRKRMEPLRTRDTFLDAIVLRLDCNLHFGEQCQTSAPGVLEAYMETAAYELAWVSGLIKSRDKPDPL